MSRAPDSSFEGPQLLPILSNGFLGDRQQGSQLRLRHQVALGS
jgi:hypothetical protein